MRIAELSRESAVPIPTIKYYLREGLLHPGERTSPNQARYDDTHLHRLRLVRALIDVGGVPVSKVRGLLDAIDARGRVDIAKALGTATHATMSENRGAEAAPEQVERAAAALDEVIAARGWTARNEDSRRLAVGALASLYQLGEEELTTLLPVYAAAIDTVAAAEVEVVMSRSDVDSMVEGAVIGTVIGEQVITALRHLAHEHHSRRRRRESPPEE